jgi:hypothetical protein
VERVQRPFAGDNEFTKEFENEIETTDLLQEKDRRRLVKKGEEKREQQSWGGSVIAFGS